MQEMRSIDAECSYKLSDPTDVDCSRDLTKSIHVSNPTVVNA